MGWGAGGSCTPRPPIRQQTAQETRVITVVFLGLLLDLLAFTLLLPLLPGLLESHGRAHDPLYGSWQRGVDWFAAAIRMPAEKRYNSVLFGGMNPPRAGPCDRVWTPVNPSPCHRLPAAGRGLPLSKCSVHWWSGRLSRRPKAWERSAHPARSDPWGQTESW